MDPFSIPVLSEVAGQVKFEDLIAGSTYVEQVDSVTGISSRIIQESKDGTLRPRVSIYDSKGRPVMVPGTERAASYRLPVGSQLVVEEDEVVDVGKPVAKVQRESTKTKDITGGLPRVAELFEARKPSNASQISDINGTVAFGPEIRGSRRVLIKPEGGGEPVTYAVPKSRHVTVNEGDYVRAGDPIMDGPPNPHDILRVLGEAALARYLIDEIQEVYRLQGVAIDDKHIEVVVSQMLKKVQITDSGDTHFVAGDSVTKGAFEEVNEEVVAEEGQPAVGQVQLLGITRASLTTDSFISAASFQETTKVLTQAALEGKKDMLRGLKENVIMGRLIPAGTGGAKYRDFTAQQVVEEEERKAAEALQVQENANLTV